MAKQPTFVRVKYVVDSEDLKKAQTASVQAQKATDNLRESVTRTGNTIKSTNRASVQSIENMTVSLARLKAQIQLTTDPKRLQQLSQQYKQLKLDLDAANKKYIELDKSVKNLNASQQQSALSISSLANAVKLFLAAGLLKQTVDIALNMAKLAGNVEGVKRAFDRLPGSLVLLDQLRDATQGTVTDFELMQRSLQARNFRIPLQQLGDLFQFATVRAQQTGQSVDYLINSIVFGLGFQSIRRLDNVGISAAELRDVMKELGVSLNEAFNIVVQREIEKMGGLIKTSATEAEIFNTRLQEIQQTFAKKVTQGGFIDFMSNGLVRLKNIIDAFPTDKITKLNPFQSFNFLRDWKNNLDEVIREQGNLKTAAEDLKVIMDGLGESQRAQADGIIQELIQRKEQVRLIEGLIDKKQAEIELNDRQNKSNSETRVQYLKTRDTLNHELLAMRNSLQVNQLIATELRKTLISLTSDTANQLGLIEAKEQEIEDISDAIKAAKSTKEIHDLNNELDKLNGELADLKAFGTTKQFLEVNGQIKLVPVVAPKNSSRVSAIGTPEATKQLEDEITKMIKGMRFNIPVPVTPQPITGSSEWEKIKDGFRAHQKEFVDIGLSATQDLIMAQYDAEVDGLNKRIDATREHYRTLQDLAGDNEREKSRLRMREDQEIKRLERERNEREKKSALASILVNTALGIIKAFATSATVYDAYANAALIALEGAAQYAVASNARYYAKGEVNIDGPGTGTSDSIKANLSKGESVINAKSTSNSLKLLEGINAGKIDDSILNRLHLSREGVKIMPADNSDIVSAIKGQQFPDVFSIGSEVYERKRDADGFSQSIRRRTMKK